MCSSASVLFRRKTAVQCSSGLHFSPMAGVRSLLFDSFELVQPDPPGLNSDGPRLLPPIGGGRPLSQACFSPTSQLSTGLFGPLFSVPVLVQALQS